MKIGLQRSSQKQGCFEKPTAVLEQLGDKRQQTVMSADYGTHLLGRHFDFGPPFEKKHLQHGQYFCTGRAMVGVLALNS